MARRRLGHTHTREWPKTSRTWQSGSASATCCSASAARSLLRTHESACCSSAARGVSPLPPTCARTSRPRGWQGLQQLHLACTRRRCQQLRARTAAAPALQTRAAPAGAAGATSGTPSGAPSSSRKGIGRYCWEQGRPGIATAAGCLGGSSGGGRQQPSEGRPCWQVAAGDPGARKLSDQLRTAHLAERLIPAGAVCTGRAGIKSMTVPGWCSHRLRWGAG